MRMISLLTSNRPDMEIPRTGAAHSNRRFYRWQTPFFDKGGTGRNPRPHPAMNSFDIAVAIGLLVAVGTGFSTGLIRSAVTIMAYLLAMPIAVWVMSYVPPLDGGSGSPLGSNWG